MSNIKANATESSREVSLRVGLPCTIRELVCQNPDDVVRRLKIPDDNYWDAVRMEIVRPFLAPGTGLGRKLKDKNVDWDDIYSRLYEKMVHQKKLDALKNNKYVLDFLLQYTRAIVSSLFERKTSKGPTVISIYAGGNDTSEDGEDSNGGLVIDTIAQQNSDDIGYDEWMRREQVRQQFNALWKKHPSRALTLLLRFVKGLSAKEVKNFMNFTTENYVNQVVNLGKNDMRTPSLSVARAIHGK